MKVIGLIVATLGVLLLAGGTAGAAPAISLYVAANGSDALSGTQPTPDKAKGLGPFATLERARDEIRKRKQAGPLPTGGVTVWIGPGIWTRTQTFALEQQDSGTADAPILYRATQPGQTRLLGGVMLPAKALAPVTDAKVLERLDPAARGRVLLAGLTQCGVPEPGPEWAERFRGAAGWPELFFDRKRMTLARWPNTGWAHVADVVGGAPHRIHGIPGDKIGRLAYDGDRPQRWVGEKEVLLHGYWFWDWSDQRQRVESIDPARKTITLAPPYHGYGYRKGARYYAQNALAELDSPGEWFVDRETWTLYFWPPVGESGRVGQPKPGGGGSPTTAKGAPAGSALPQGHEISYSVLSEPLVTLTDTSYVVLRGLSFEVARGEGVQVRGGTANLVAGCTFRNLARLAVRVEGGTKHGVVGCDLYNLGMGGINLSGGDRNTLAPAGHYAENNHIHHFAQLAYTYQNGIRMNGVGCRMAHNLVHDTIHEALCYSGNDHVVEFNEVHSVCLEADDSGVIHQGRDWTWRGNVIRYNFFHDVIAGNAVSNMGVYLDDMECGVDVYGNVLYRIPRAVLAGGGRDNLIRNNVIVDCPISIHVDNRAMNWAGYHVGTTMKGLLDKVPYKDAPWRTRYPKLVGIWEDEPAVPKGNVVQHNLMVNSGPMSLAGEVPKFGTVADNLFLKSDPGFVNPAALDFRLKDVAAVQKQLPGFQPIPFEKIGLVVDEYRRALPVGTPVITPDSRAFVGALTVGIQLGRGSRQAVIRYTLDGSEPTAKSPVCTGPLKLTRTVALRAAAFPTAGGEPSGMASAAFTAYQLGPQGGVSLAGLPADDVAAHGGLKVDRNYAGDGPASLAGRKYERSLMLCPEAGPAGGRGEATFALAGGLEKAALLKATIGVEDTVKPNGSVLFIVEVERGGKWERVFESGMLRGGEAKEIAVPIAGATRLRLVTTDAGDNIHSDHAVWAAPLLQ